MNLNPLCVIGLFSAALISGCGKKDQSLPAEPRKLSITEHQRLLLAEQRKNIADIRRRGPEAAGYTELKGQDLLNEFMFKKKMSEQEKKAVFQKIRLYKKANSYHLVNQQKARVSDSEPVDFEFAVNSDDCICAGVVTMCDPTGIVDDECTANIGGAIYTDVPYDITWVVPAGVGQWFSGDYIAFSGGYAVVTMTLPVGYGLGLRNCIFDNSVEEWIIPLNESRTVTR